MPIYNGDYENSPSCYLIDQVEEGIYSWEHIARAFMYNLSHDQIVKMINDQDLEPHQHCEICDEYFSIHYLTVEEYSEAVCCQSCLPQRQDESHQEQLENGELKCTDCGEEDLNEKGECPACMNDPEY